MRGGAGGIGGGLPFWSLGGLAMALIALALSQLLHTIAPPEGADVTCDAAPPITISLPATLAPARAGASPTPALATPARGTATASAATPAAAPATPALAAPAIQTRNLFRADDPPLNHGLAIVDGPLVPLYLPVPCRVTQEQRRARPLPCVTLLAPGGKLCATGATGSGRLVRSVDAPLFALQAEHVTLRGTGGEPLFDALQGYVRYDDPEHGLQLICTRITQLQSVSSNARTLAADCSNMGADGWSIAGQVTDGGTAAPDSVSLTIRAPDGKLTPLVGPLSAGSIVVDDVPADDQ